MLAINRQMQSDQLVRTSFYLTYVMLITTGTITFIEALRTKSTTVRHIMNLETCISIIAAFFYSQFVEKLKQQSTIPYAELNLTRYTDWFISTPFMLLVLCVFLANEHKEVLNFHIYLIVLLLNIGMLAMGYLGEVNVINKPLALVSGFAFFIALFAYIWFMFLAHGHTHAAMFTFLVFVVIWSLYGLVYMTDEKTKNVVYNVLDLIAKCLVGIFFWMYLTDVVD